MKYTCEGYFFQLWAQCSINTNLAIHPFIDVFSRYFITYIKWDINIFYYGCEITYCSLCQFLFHVFWTLVSRQIYTYDCFVFLMNWSLRDYELARPLYLCNTLCPDVYFSDNLVVTTDLIDWCKDIWSTSFWIAYNFILIYCNKCCLLMGLSGMLK